MKISHIILSLGKGGAEKLLVDHLPLYLKYGHQVEIVQLSSILEAPDYIAEMKRHDIPVITLSRGNFYNPLLLLKIYKFLKKTDSDIVHAHLFQSSYFVSLASRLLRKSSFKLTFTEHNSENGRNTKKILQPLEKYIYSKYDGVIAISNYINEKLTIWLGPSIKIVTLHNGVDVEKFKGALSYSTIEFNKILHRSDDKNYIDLLMVARFSPQKNHQMLIDALQYLDSKFHVTFVGDGIGLEKIKFYVRDNSLHSRVHFLGFRNDIPRLMKTASINVLSTHFEGMSGVTLEGMASGKPFIGSNVKGVNDIQTNPKYLFTNNEPNSLALLILKINENNTFRNNLILSQNSIIEIYSSELMVKNHLNFYNEILKN